MQKQLRQSEKGIVSIVVTLIIMIIITLIVVGFAQLSRREQEQSLDRQLNTQAFYAAESAVNDTQELFNGNAVDVNEEYLTDCSEFITTESLNPQVGDDPNVKYTCLLVDPSPTELRFEPVDTVGSRIFPVKAKNNVDIGKIIITWQPKDAEAADNHNQGDCPSTVGEFPTSWQNGCNVGILRTDLARYPGGVAQTRSTLISNTFSGFLYPAGTDGTDLSVASGSGLTNGGVIKSGNCTSEGVCKVTISNINSSVNFMRIRSIYTANSVTVTAEDTSGNPVELVEAQAVVDATGRAKDILRRIQVRIGIHDFNRSIPENVLQTADTICKRYGVSLPSNTVIVQSVGGDAASCAID